MMSLGTCLPVKVHTIIMAQLSQVAINTVSRVLPPGAVTHTSPSKKAKGHHQKGNRRCWKQDLISVAQN